MTRLTRGSRLVSYFIPYAWSDRKKMLKGLVKKKQLKITVFYSYVAFDLRVASTNNAFIEKNS